VRIFVRAKQVKDAQVPELSAQIAHEIENEMQYPGMIKVTVIRETTATATAPAQIAAVLEANRRRAGNGNGNGNGSDVDATSDADEQAGAEVSGEDDDAPMDSAAIDEVSPAES
jgi:hypothetical protein